MRLFQTAAAVVVAIATTACAPEKPEIVARNSSGEQKQVAVVVGNESFTLEQVTLRLDVMPEWARARFSTVDRKKSFLATTVQFELLHDEAQKLRYDRHPDTIHHLERRLVEAWLDEEIEKAPISADELRAHYKTNIDAFRRGTARKTYVLQSGSEERIKELRKRIMTNEGDRLAAFRELSRKFSLHFPSSVNRGLIGAVTADGEVAAVDESPVSWTPEDGDDELTSRVWQLDEGEVSEVIEMGDDWWIVMWSDELPPEQVEFDDVASEVRRHLLEHRRHELIESYRK